MSCLQERLSEKHEFFVGTPVIKTNPIGEQINTLSYMSNHERGLPPIFEINHAFCGELTKSEQTPRGVLIKNPDTSTITIQGYSRASLRLS